MPYSDESLVTELTRSVQDRVQGRVPLYQTLADGIINGKLSALFAVPLTPDANGDYPSPVPECAALLAAALYSANAFSMTSLGATQNPYAKKLFDEYTALMSDILSGKIVLIGQTRKGALPVHQAANREDALTEIRQLRNTGPS